MRPIPGIAYAFATEGGEIYSTNPENKWRGRLRKLIQRDNGRGYMRVMCGGKLRCVHLLVAEVFLGPKPEGKEVNHIDGNKLNNSPSNLEYVTRSDNMKHCHLMGLAPNHIRGSRHPNSKLNEEDVRELRAIHAKMAVEGRMPDGSMRALSEKYGINRYAITAVMRKKTWKHVK